MAKTFRCYICNEDEDAAYLSPASARRAGTRSKQKAIDSLPAHDLVCIACDTEDYITIPRHTATAWNDYVSTVPESLINVATKDWLNLYY